jgi:hypothetical protein
MTNGRQFVIDSVVETINQHGFIAISPVGRSTGGQVGDGASVRQNVKVYHFSPAPFSPLFQKIQISKFRPWIYWIYPGDLIQVEWCLEWCQVNYFLFGILNFGD